MRIVKFLSTCLGLMLTASSMTSAEEGAKPKLPLGVPADAKFFKGKWYYCYLVPGSWKSSRDKCARTGGQLATIPDEATNQFLKELAKDLVVWLGATDEKVEGLWVWSDGSQMKYTHWLGGEPNNLGRREHYLTMSKFGAWNDVVENEKTVVGYLCEWKAP